MSKYTTGEIAKLCGVTVRTVQYYDKRGLLAPSELSEGGRRLYSENDLRKLKIICFLRELGLPIDAISQMLSEEDPDSVISLLLEQQKSALKEEISELQAKLGRLEALTRELRSLEHISLESIGDIAYTMSNKKKLGRVHTIMLLAGIPLGVLQWAGIALWIAKGRWQLFAVWAALVIPCAILLMRYYHRSVAYICPQCHAVFKPGMKEFFRSSHTPATRRLHCPACGRRSFCVETWGGEAE